MRYRKTWDLTTIPEEPFKAEVARRTGIKGGRPVVLRPCPYCQQPFGTVALRRHQPSCLKKPNRK